ncbi:MAG TPA: energy transducer TonB [Candidatus Acidoferrum sp.]|nr:energy transducer TonB [Candidatus Acidoferrum sp.]
MDSRQEHSPEHGNERNSSAAPAAESSQVELNKEASPAPSVEEPGDDAGIPLKTKPLPRVNAVAREVPVRVTGAKAGSASEERDLFSELTSTVLVFEKGGVIRLTAAVTPGQLLFLSNEESNREVVTQVIRKRTHRPTECYVELEFTEPAPKFWGTEFSAATALLPKDAKLVAAAELISSSETTGDELDENAPPPSTAEVEALKKEVEALRSQLSQLQTPAEPAGVEPPLATPKPPSLQPLDTSASQPSKPETLSYQTEKAPWTELSADVAPKEGEPKRPREYSPDQELAQLVTPKPAPPQPALDFHVPVPKRSGSFRARGQFTPGFRSGMLRMVILSGVLAALIGFVWYKRWLPWMHQPTKFSVSTFAAGVTTKVAPEASTAVSPSATPPTKAATGAKESLGAKGATSGTEPSSETTTGAPAGGAYEVVKPATHEISKPPVSIANAKPSPVHPQPTKMVTPVPASTANGTIIPPKLIKSEPAIATLDDLHDFETGSVMVDAIVDTDGIVSSPTVLSGPPSLRRPALEAVKYYRYQPAMQNGHPVAARVTLKIQFHFE